MATTFTCFENQPGMLSFSVTAKGDCDLTVDAASTLGWTRVVQVQAKKATIQSTTIYATTAIFRNPSAGVSDTLIINSSRETEFAGLSLGT